jgi:hypothetical protein
MSKHTPGPWFTTPQYGNYAVYSRGLVGDDTGDGWEPCICELDSDEPVNHEANARLIAAAPELLEALRDLELGANTVDYCYLNMPGNFAEALLSLRAYAKTAREAIAKATGE